jgi:hypothetical protein
MAPAPDQGLSVGAKAGIGVGAAIGVFLVFGAVVWLFRRRRKTAVAPPGELSGSNTFPPAHGVQETSYRPQGPQSELSGYGPEHQSGWTSYKPATELAGDGQQPKYQTPPPHEMY